MRRTFFLVALLVPMLIFVGCESPIEPVAPEVVLDDTMASKATKTTLCHYSADDGAFYRISVSINAADAHMNHGDVEFNPLDPNCFPAPDFVSDDGIQFRRIPSGILAPCPEWAIQHGVSCTINHDFYIGIYEVSQAEWESIMGAGTNPSRFKPPLFPHCPNCPVETLGWTDAQALAANLNSSEGTDTYRLPSAIEWEYAYRAGTLTDYYWGENYPPTAAGLDAHAWYADNHGWPPTNPVGQKAPNAWGLYDMSGNVGEFQADVYELNPNRPILRGGSSAYQPQWLQAHYRFLANSLSSTNDDFGMRLAKDVE
ncbi:MAG: formylglycine-generating enzyme family protein [Rhodothermales bacterium]|nr:formylglycine-generating enzyme family protein [Rhodothermales bacterium]